MLTGAEPVGHVILSGAKNLPGLRFFTPLRGVQNDKGRSAI
jgi:hypothetical protein